MANIERQIKIIELAARGEEVRDAITSSLAAINDSIPGSVEDAVEQARVSGLFKGDKGDAGEAGFSPSVTVEEITGGHRVTVTDEAHPDGQIFDVHDGAGEMPLSVYDPDEAVADAGGIVKYVKGTVSGMARNPDWDEYMPTSPGFIKNRTHYATPVFSNRPFTEHNYGYRPVSLYDEEFFTSGMTYTTLTTNAASHGFPSATIDGSMPLVKKFIENRVSENSLSNTPDPPNLTDGQLYRILIDGKVVYSGSATSTSTIFYSYNSVDGLARPIESTMLGSEGAGIIIYTRLVSGAKQVVYDEYHWLSYKDREYYFFLSEELAAESHTIEVQVKSGETVKLLPNKYLDMDTKPIANNQRPITSGGVYTALAKKAPDFIDIRNVYLGNLYEGSYFLTADDYFYYRNTIGDLASLLLASINNNTLKTRKKTVVDAINELYELIKTKVDEAVEDRISTLENRIAALENRVYILESQAGADGLSIIVEGENLTIIGNGASVGDDGILDIISPNVSVVDGVLTTISSNSSSSVFDGELQMSGGGVSFSDGILDVMGASIGNDGVLQI